jgi:hypothetical protein
MWLRLAPTNTIKEVVNLSRVVLWLGAAFLSPAQAQDVITFKNGDRLTGTIKYLDRGRLIVKSRLLNGDAKVDWKQVVRVESDRLFLKRLLASVSWVASARKRVLANLPNELVILMGSLEQQQVNLIQTRRAKLQIVKKKDVSGLRQEPNICRNDVPYEIFRAP